MSALVLLGADGTLTRAPLADSPGFSRPAGPLRSRSAFAAVHVVPKAWADNTPGRPADIDWDATLGFRRHIFSWGLGVADAMDTAQRNMGLDPAATRELITRSAAVAQEEGGALVVGVNTDHVDEPRLTLRQVTDAYREQLHFTEDRGADAVLMASRHLAAAASTADDYRRVYGDVLRAAGKPVLLHWLGPVFDPSLAGYFGHADWQPAARVLLDIIADAPGKVAGVKMSLLDASAERWVRDRLPDGVRMYTGDDHHYVSLIADDPEAGPRGHSDALLGAFAALAPSASAAIQALDDGDPQRFLDVLGPTEELSRQLFAIPTWFYKTGVAFLSWLNGHQPAFQMVGGLHASRSLPHLSRLIELANAVRALERPDLAAARWTSLLRLNGVEA